jgi:hypothetical protein
MLQGYSLLPTLYIIGTSLAIYLLKLAIVRVETYTAHLLGNHISGKRYDTYIVSWLCLNSDNVTTLKVEVIDILIVRTAGVLESNLEDICRNIYRILLEPVCFVELIATLRCDSLYLIATVTEGTSTPYLWNMFFTTTHYS